MIEVRAATGRSGGDPGAGAERAADEPDGLDWPNFVVADARRARRRDGAAPARGGGRGRARLAGGAGPPPRAAGSPGGWSRRRSARRRAGCWSSPRRRARASTRAGASGGSPVAGAGRGRGSTTRSGRRRRRSLRASLRGACSAARGLVVLRARPAEAGSGLTRSSFLPRRRVAGEPEAPRPKNRRAGAGRRARGAWQFRLADRPAAGADDAQAGAGGLRRAVLRPRLRLRDHPALAPAAAPLHARAGRWRPAMLLLAVWWVWIYTTWALNWLDPQRDTGAGDDLRLDAARALHVDVGAGGVRDARARLRAVLRGDAGRASLFTAWCFAGDQRAARATSSGSRAWLARRASSGSPAGLLEGEARLAAWLVALGIEYLGPVGAVLDARARARRRPPTGTSGASTSPSAAGSSSSSASARRC